MRSFAPEVCPPDSRVCLWSLFFEFYVWCVFDIRGARKHAAPCVRKEWALWKRLGSWQKGNAREQITLYFPASLPTCARSVWIELNAFVTWEGFPSLTSAGRLFLFKSVLLCCGGSAVHLARLLALPEVQQSLKMCSHLSCLLRCFDCTFVCLFFFISALNLCKQEV